VLAVILGYSLTIRISKKFLIGSHSPPSDRQFRSFSWNSQEEPCQTIELVIIVFLEEHLPQEGAERSNTGAGRKLEAIGMTVKFLAFGTELVDLAGLSRLPL